MDGLSAGEVRSADADGLSPRTIGVIGGTFDPIHVGHLIVAEHVRDRLGLTTMLFVPARVNPLKTADAPTLAVDRLRMLRLALEDHPGFQIDLVDLERVGPSYTVDMIASLRERLGADVDLIFVLGADSLMDLPRWHEPERLIRQTRLAMVPRPGFTPDLDALEKALPGLRGALLDVDAPLIEISATDLRRRVAGGRSIRYLVPEPVRRYIEANGLYTDRAL